MGELRYVNLTPEYAAECEKLELLSFSDTEPADLIDEEGFRAYASTFPEGFFLCLDGDRLVGQAAGIFLDFDFDHPQHSIAEITGAPLNTVRDRLQIGRKKLRKYILNDPELRACVPRGKQ